MADIANSAEALAASKAAFADPAMQAYFQRWQVAYHAAMTQCNIKETNQLGEDAEKHGAFWQNFWEALPNNSSIRTGLFYTVCDLGEWFCFGDR